MAELPEKHRKRRKVYNTPYHAHFLTFSCFKRQAFFSGDLAPWWFLECLDTARRATPFGLWAFVIMPEHVHLVIAPGENYNISHILARIKRPVTTKAVDHVKHAHPAFLCRMTERRPGGRVTRRFWKPGGGYDRNLWTPREIHKTIRYVHDNPVRRGLVEKPQDWPWTSYRTWTGEDPEPLTLDLEDVPTLMTEHKTTRPARPWHPQFPLAARQWHPAPQAARWLEKALASLLRDLLASPHFRRKL